ncbi:MAG TPA: sigma-70 family RNA polymerase sigma factor [Microlunatus sp.]|nr:sigma-70 family RNA polymerase sigma factor [Microlunatus sp.]
MGVVADAGEPAFDSDTAMEALIPIVARVVRARVTDANLAEDLVQETLVRVLARANRVAPGMLEPYAIVTARNVVASQWTERDRQRRNQHRALEVPWVESPDEQVLKDVDAQAISEALTRLSEHERATLLAHEVSGRDTKSLGSDLGMTPGAVAAQLNRSRARLRVEYLLAVHGVDPPTDRCRPVLLALSSADRRRQSEVGAARHLLECDCCSMLSGPLMERGQPRENEIRVKIGSDADIVLARKGARELAGRLSFSATEMTVIATAVSEISRNIVRFAERGEVFLELVDTPRPGLRVVARDTGPGIADIELAMTDGYSTYHGLGLGLPGARRLMDEFDVVTERGRGTTITMTKWRREG